MQNAFNVWSFGDKLVEKLVFGRSGLNSSVFEKLLISYSCILFMKYCALRSFCIKLLCFSKIWFFHASFMFRIHIYCIVFLYPSCSFVVISLIVSHITCIHFVKLGTQLDLKIDWLIFWAMYFLVYAIFMCVLQEIFFLKDMMDNQCANIFSTHVTVYGSLSVKFAFIERENIFSLCVSST